MPLRTEIPDMSPAARFASGNRGGIGRALEEDKRRRNVGGVPAPAALRPVAHPQSHSVEHGFERQTALRIISANA